jgi:hypothetical protein
MHGPAARQHRGGADHALDRPVAPFGEHVGPAGLDQPGGRVLVEPGDRVHRLERGDERQTVRETVDRAPGPLAQAPRGGIAVQRHQQRGAQRPRPREVGDVAAVQQVEHAVGEHERPRRFARPTRRGGRVEDLALEVRRA